MIRLKLLELFSYRDFLLLLVRQQLAQRYQGSVLGFLWTLLNPALVYASFTFVFAKLNHWDMRDFGLYFLSGYLAWNLFSNSCLASADSIPANAAYVTKIYAPKALFPLAAVAVNVVDLAASFLIVIALAVLYGNISWTVLFVPVAVAITTVFVAGIAFLCAWWNIVFRDFRHLLASLLFIWFFCSPILWKASALPADARIVSLANPMVPFLQLFQDTIWGGRFPSGSNVGWAAALACVSAAIGFVAFIRAERNFYYYL